MKELDTSGFIDRLYKSTTMATAASHVEPAAPPVVAAREKTVPLAEAKPKPVAAEEKAKPVAKQISGSTEKAATAVTAKATIPGTQEYTVKLGDSLSKLAERFYNSTSKWEKIYEANRDTVKNPHYIYVGQKLMIPADDQAS
jgi:nucleoid-associated protein YgaU